MNQQETDQLIRQLLSAGAHDVWVVRKAATAQFHYTLEAVPGMSAHPLRTPHELILVVRFPTGDGGTSGLVNYTTEPSPWADTDDDLAYEEDTDEDDDSRQVGNDAQVMSICAAGSDP